MFSFGSAPIASTSVLERLRIELPVGAVSAPAASRGSRMQMLPSYVMLDSMAGVHGPRDELTRYTAPETGAYYFVPALAALRAFGTREDDG
jgi:hypothetical protein